MSERGVPFTHLHVHSEYSLLDGAARVEELPKRAAELGMKALALTDHGVMYGVVEFYKACRANGIKPILGCEAYITEGSRHTRGTRKEQPIYHLILLARNAAGYRNLLKLCSIGHLEGFHYRPRIDMEALERHAEGITCLSSCLGGEIAQHLLHDRYEEAKKAAERYRGIFGEHYYLELQDHGMLEQRRVNVKLIELSRETGIPLVATNDAHYVRREDQLAQDILICIGTGKTLEDEERLKFQTDQMYLKSPEEMAELFPHVPEALENTMRIADSCEVELEFGRSILPAFKPLPDGMSADSYLAELCEQGLLSRYADKPEWSDAAFRETVRERLRYELGVISRMGYSDYFLIVWDFINYSHTQGIMTGPGRGSSAGSLVAYALNITDVDPIKYKLLFERFLNPERISMPDIDIDFNDERRDEVIDYVVRKYGAEHVAQIITFGTMAARAAVRDVGRVLNMPYNEVDRAAKLIPGMPGMTLEHAVKTSPELTALAAKHPRTAELLQLARKVEGFPRHASTHAAGVVISREPLTHYVPLQEGTGGVPLTQLSMEHLEAIGLLKMDFLGLRTLSIIERTLQWIEERHGVRIDLRTVPDHDPRTYELLSRGDTTGIFQLESPGMRRVLRDLKPSEFEDIISVLALYRPGPMEFIPRYVQAKHGHIRVEYPHPSLEPILKDTYGIIVYQEQIMQIASAMAGFTLGEADLLRRAVSKKKREVLDEQRAKFVAGSVKQGYEAADADRVYDMIVRFADYGFPRAHATAYGVLAFQTAYLKAHYPAEFMASMLTSVLGNHRKVAEYVDDCKRLGIPVLPPDVNESGVTFTPVDRDGQRAIRFGLGAVKNVGLHAMESIMDVRKEGPFDNLVDFTRRVDLRVCNKRVIESLIQAGAMDAFPGHRAQLIAMLDDCVESAVKWKKEREDLQLHLFGFTEKTTWTVDYPDVRPYGETEQLELERELLGLYLSGHPLDAYEEMLERRKVTPIHYLHETKDGETVRIAGRIIGLKPIVSKKGSQMAFMELEDRYDKVEVVVFPEAWKAYSSLLERGKLVFMTAKIQHQDEDVKAIADKIYDIEAAPMPSERPAASAGRSGFSTGGGVSGGRADRAAQRPAVTNVTLAANQKVYIKIASGKDSPVHLQQLKRVLTQHAGALDIILFYESTGKTLALKEDYRVKPSPLLTKEVEALLGKGCIKVK